MREKINVFRKTPTYVLLYKKNETLTSLIILVTLDKKQNYRTREKNLTCSDKKILIKQIKKP
ncbi:hypothetical protein Hanom_Chr08g00736121 [Helianthus anomalus]